MTRPLKIGKDIHCEGDTFEFKFLSCCSQCFFFWEWAWISNFDVYLAHFCGGMNLFSTWVWNRYCTPANLHSRNHLSSAKTCIYTYNISGFFMCFRWRSHQHDTVDERNPAPVEAGGKHPIIYRVLAPSQVVGLGISEPSTAMLFGREKPKLVFTPHFRPKLVDQTARP